MDKGIIDLGGIKTVLLKQQKDDQRIKIKIESPLDLTIKPISSIHDMSNHSPLKKRYRDADNIENFSCDFNRKENSPIKKRYREENQTAKIDPVEEIKPEKTPKRKSSKLSVNLKASKNHPKANVNEKASKAIRKLKFDEFRSSPVSGTIIRTLDEIEENGIHESGDIDPQYNVVEITEEAKCELAQIKNVIGAYQCKLCTLEFEDAFLLAMHRCSCIVLIDYRCPECGKKFNCPANLASHRRWHKPRDQINKKSNLSESESSYSCKICGKNFKRQAYLNKHLALHNKKVVADKTIFAQNDDSFMHNTSSTHDSADVLIPQSVYTFNREPSPTSSYNSEHDLIIDENSNASSNRFMNSDSGTRNFQIISSHFTEDESIAISALTNLRNSSSCSVIRHTLTI
ncbi:unnamed protein product [Chironomus riparius]|uniref:C2H2-type domain-containing protein n=1 Tax=Chironomus riparius TaxID=315576 RepID=A0A9N9RWI3_9DIPT|nr:unnamed protein product [Chironomus riparius]